jgi:hypothetical protein
MRADSSPGRLLERTLIRSLSIGLALLVRHKSLVVGLFCTLIDLAIDHDFLLTQIGGIIIGTNHNRSEDDVRLPSRIFCAFLLYLVISSREKDE